MLFRSDRKSTRLNSSHTIISYAVFCLKKKKNKKTGKRNHPRINVEHQGQQRTSSAPFQAHIEILPHPPVTLSCFATFFFFFFNDTATPEIYPLSLPDALPI